MSSLAGLPALPGLGESKSNSSSDATGATTLASFDVPIPIHDAYHACPVVSVHDLRDLCLSVQVEVFMRGKLEARVTVRDKPAGGVCVRTDANHLIPCVWRLNGCPGARDIG